VAEELANTLTQMLSGAAKGKAPGTTATIFEGEIRVTADKPTNSLVITASNRDYAALRLVIAQLDQPRRQVFIEAVIMDVSVDHSTSLGLSYHAGTMQDLGGPGDSLIWGGLDPLTSAGQPQSVDPTNLQALALGVRGPTLEGSADMFGFSVPAFGVVLHALATSGDANVLATPHILATDNVAAEINVGENIPLQENFGGLPNLSALAGGAQGTQTGAASQRALSSLMFGGYGGYNTPRQDVGTKIKVTPHINESNQVRLEIEEEISEMRTLPWSSTISRRW
jgi:general secretion pathway protein D